MNEIIIKEPHEYIIPTEILNPVELSIVKQMVNLLSCQDQQAKLLDFILKNLSKELFKTLLFKLDPHLYTIFITPTNDDLESLKNSLFIVGSLCRYPEYINLLINYNLEIFEQLISVLHNSTGDNLVECIYRIFEKSTQFAENKNDLEMIIQPIIGLWESDIQWRRKTSRCIFNLIEKNDRNKLLFVKNNGIEAAITVLISHNEFDQMFAVKIIQSLMKDGEEKVRNRLRVELVNRNVLVAIKPTLMGSKQLANEGWITYSRFIQVDGIEEHYIHSGVFMTAVQLIGEVTDENIECLTGALSVILKVMMQEVIPDICRGYVLVGRLKQCLEQMNMYAENIKKSLMNICLFLTKDEDMIYEMKNANIARHLQAPYLNIHLEQTRRQVLEKLSSSTVVSSPQKSDVSQSESNENQVELPKRIGVPQMRQSFQERNDGEINFKKQQSRQIIEEIIYTETDYCNHLKTCTQIIKPLFEKLLSDTEV